MRKVCPQCQGTFHTQFLCPTCGVQLLDLPDRSAVIAAAAADEGLGADRLGPQVLAGMVLAQGLYFAVRQAAIGLAMLGVMPEQNNILVMAGLQVLTALAGGLVTGVGNPKGLAAGTAVGALNAVLFIVTEVALGGQAPATFPLWVLVPTIAAGAMGGLYARQKWPSVHDLPDPSGRAKVKKVKVKKEAPPVPIAYLRILSGAALAIGCTVWAGYLRDTVVALGAGTFIVENRIQSQFIAWVITTLAMVIGGAFAGAGTPAGVRHGFLVGLVSCVGIFVIHQKVVQEILPAEEFFAALLRMPEDGTPSTLQMILFLLTNTLLIGVLSGWFGSKLLPKLGQRRPALDSGAI